MRDLRPRSGLLHRLRARRNSAGALLTLAIGAVSLWLAATGQLVLYIHPRYVVFTVVLVVIGMALAVLSLVRRDGDGHGHDAASIDDGAPGADSADSRTAARARRRFRPLVVGSALLVAAVTAALVVLPPATLSSTTASTRGLGDAVTTTGTDRTDGATAKYTVLDWATKLRTTTDIGAYENEAVDVLGFVSPSPDDPENSFYVTRFVITCCAVDAQPVGVPVYDPGWSDTLKKDEWVRVTGAFAVNPSRSSSDAITLVPTDLAKAAQPRDPYLS